MNGARAPHAARVFVISDQSCTEPNSSAACLARWARSLGVMGAPAAAAVARIKPAASGARSPVFFWSSSSELMASSAELELSLESSRSILVVSESQRLPHSVLHSCMPTGDARLPRYTRGRAAATFLRAAERAALRGHGGASSFSEATAAGSIAN